MINLQKPRTTTKDIKFIAVKDTGSPEAVYKANNQVFYAEVQQDQDGEYYFLHLNRAHYLPQEFQQD